MAPNRDALSNLGPVLRVRPELQDYCRFGGGWCSPHVPQKSGWAAFHIVTKGACEVERADQPPVQLKAGDVLLLPHGDGHVVYSSGNRRRAAEIVTTPRDYIRVKQTQSKSVDTELICGRLHLESSSENLILRALPYAIVLDFSGESSCRVLVEMMNRELSANQAGAIVIASELASALFVMLLRKYLQSDRPAEGIMTLLTARETAKAAAAMLEKPNHNWSLDELASLAAVSRATFVRAFRRISGMPPAAFLTELRLAVARNRISQTADSLAQIAAVTGYQSESALSRALFRQYGIRPGAMRGTSE